MELNRRYKYSEFDSFGKIPRSGIAGSYGGAIPSLLRNLLLLFEDICQIILIFCYLSCWQIVIFLI